MTAFGFCVVAALSSHTSGRPFTCSAEDREVATDGIDVERRMRGLKARRRGAQDRGWRWAGNTDSGRTSRPDILQEII